MKHSHIIAPPRRARTRARASSAGQLTIDGQLSCTYAHDPHPCTRPALVSTRLDDLCAAHAKRLGVGLKERQR